MDPSLYQNIVNHIKFNSFPVDVTEKEKNYIIQSSKKYTIVNNLLFKKGEKKLKVLKKYEIEPILFMLHNHPLGGHFGTEIVAEKVKESYYWPQYYEDIKTYIKACDACQRRGRRKVKEPLHPIEVGKPFERIGIDFVGPLPLTSHGN